MTGPCISATGRSIWAAATHTSASATWSIESSYQVAEDQQFSLALVGSSGPPASCYKQIDRGETKADRWKAACTSVSRPGIPGKPGSHAAYYTYTPAADGSIELTVTSPDAEEVMYLWEDDKLVAEANSSARTHAYLFQRVTAGRTYTIEVTGGGVTGGEATAAGRYMLALHGPNGVSLAPECRTTLGLSERPAETIADDHNDGGTHKDLYYPAELRGSTSGTLDWPCHSSTHKGSYARYYTFTLAQDWTKDQTVAVELYTGPRSPRMYLRQGTQTSGAHLGQSSRDIGPVTARMSGTLRAGTYTIEVTSATPGDGGVFTVAVKNGPEPWTPPNQCVSSISVTSAWQGFPESGARSGVWAEPCHSGTPSDRYSTRHARWYTFTLDNAATVEFEASTDDSHGRLDAYLYLRAGRTYNGFAIVDNDEKRPYRWRPGWTTADPGFTVDLAPGTYTVEVTTGDYWAKRTGTFGMAYRTIPP